jgi:hypothetical protein
LGNWPIASPRSELAGAAIDELRVMTLGLSEGLLSERALGAIRTALDAASEVADSAYALQLSRQNVARAFLRTHRHTIKGLLREWASDAPLSQATERAWYAFLLSATVYTLVQNHVALAFSRPKLLASIVQAASSFFDKVPEAQAAAQAASIAVWVLATFEGLLTRAAMHRLQRPATLAALRSVGLPPPKPPPLRSGPERIRTRFDKDGETLAALAARLYTHDEDDAAAELRTGLNNLDGCRQAASKDKTPHDMRTALECAVKGGKNVTLGEMCKHLKAPRGCARTFREDLDSALKGIADFETGLTLPGPLCATCATLVYGQGELEGVERIVEGLLADAGGADWVRAHGQHTVVGTLYPGIARELGLRVKLSERVATLSALVALFRQPFALRRALLPPLVLATVQTVGLREAREAGKANGRPSPPATAEQLRSSVPARLVDRALELRLTVRALGRVNEALEVLVECAVRFHAAVADRRAWGWQHFVASADLDACVESAVAVLLSEQLGHAVPLAAQAVAAEAAEYLAASLAGAAVAGVRVHSVLFELEAPAPGAPEQGLPLTGVAGRAAENMRAWQGLLSAEDALSGAERLAATRLMPPLVERALTCFCESLPAAEAPGTAGPWAVEARWSLFASSFYCRKLVESLVLLFTGAFGATMARAAGAEALRTAGGLTRAYAARFGGLMLLSALQTLRELRVTQATCDARAA